LRDPEVLFMPLPRPQSLPESTTILATCFYFLVEANDQQKSKSKLIQFVRLNKKHASFSAKAALSAGNGMGARKGTVL
jgi:hypothetical protein